MAGELVVERIENGTVIDHIPAGMGLKVLGLLNVGKGSKVALLMNVPSKRSGLKDVVKISGKNLDEREVNKIALVAPGATLNIIKSGAVVDKSGVRQPAELRGAAKCPNPSCVTNSERVETRFETDAAGRLRCHYCERVFEAADLVI